MSSYNDWLQQQTQSNSLGQFGSMAGYTQAPQMFNQGMSFPATQGMDAASNFRMSEIAANPSVVDAFNSYGGGGHWTSPVLDKLTPGKDFMGGMLGKTENGIKTDGWGSMALGVASGLMNGYMGMKNYGLAKETLANNKAQFERNFGAQAKITNSSLADRQDRRVADATLNGNAGSVRSTKDYMSQYGVA